MCHYLSPLDVLLFYTIIGISIFIKFIVFWFYNRNKSFFFFLRMWKEYELVVVENEYNKKQIIFRLLSQTLSISQRKLYGCKEKLVGECMVLLHNVLSKKD